MKMVVRMEKQRRELGVVEAQEVTLTQLLKALANQTRHVLPAPPGTHAADRGVSAT
jgi:hypothetical protein